VHPISVALRVRDAAATIEQRTRYSPSHQSFQCRKHALRTSPKPPGNGACLRTVASRIFVELFQTGRWKRYFSSEEDFLNRMREAMALRDRWAEIAQLPPPAAEDEQRKAA
jgi:hypothetical protein